MSEDLIASPKTPIVRILRPVREFAGKEIAGGVLLLICAAAALGLANSPWAEAFAHLWHIPFGVELGEKAMRAPLHFWVNDALMVVFFFVVGLEIKRELLVGELASPRQAALPILAALGGVLAPAAIYSTINAGGPGAGGWGVPMATDIAFVIGVMALLGDRVPLSLKIFLTALAIVDDIAAVLVIAVFYTSGIDGMGLALAALCTGVLAAANLLGVRHPLPYAILGVLLWLAVLQSGIHATIAGVVLAMTIPSRTVLDPKEFLAHSRMILGFFERAGSRDRSVMEHEELQDAIEALEDSCEKAQPPLHRMERALHPWVTLLVMPLFALANAGVTVDDRFRERLGDPVLLGVLAGLVLGKPLGIFVFSWLSVRLGAAALPEGVRWGQVHGAAWLGGIGFTMSLFIAGLAFPDEGMLATAKLGILGASAAASLAGGTLLLWRGKAAA